MDISIDRAPGFTFTSKKSGEEFLKKLRDLAYKVDVVTMNDILKEYGCGKIPEGYMYGYHRSEVKKLKVEEAEHYWHVIFPIPGKLIRNQHGYWTTDNIKTLESVGGV